MSVKRDDWLSRGMKKWRRPLKWTRAEKGPFFFASVRNYGFWKAILFGEDPCGTEGRFFEEKGAKDGNV